MYHVKAKLTTVVIGERVFSPALATAFADGELPPEVAERDDLLHIVEVPDAESTLEAGGLAATGTLQAEGEAGEEAPATGAEVGGETPAAPDDEAGEDLLTDEALLDGVTVLSVGDGDEPGQGPEPDPFAELPSAAEPQAPAQGRGKGGRGGRK